MDSPVSGSVIDVTRLKHHEDLEKVSDIIEALCEEKDSIGFRFTYKPATECDVIPQKYKSSNSGINPTKEELDVLPYDKRKKYATERGISMFTSPDAAKIKAKQLSENIEKKNGKIEAEQFEHDHPYIAKFIIPASSGIVTKPNKENHFNFFPYDDVEVLNLIDETFEYIKIKYHED